MQNYKKHLSLFIAIIVPFSSFSSSLFAGASVPLVKQETIRQESMERIVKELEAQRLAVIPYESISISTDLPVNEQIAIAVGHQRKPALFLQQKAVYSTLKKFYKNHPAVMPQIIDDMSVWHDLTIPVGNKLNAPCIADALHPTYTKNGHAFRASMLLAPTANIPLLQKRQELIQQLSSVYRTEDAALLDEQFALIASHEDLLLSSLQDDDFFLRDMKDHLMPTGMKETDDVMARSVPLAECMNAGQHYGRAFTATVVALTPLLLCGYIYKKYNDIDVLYSENVDKLVGTAATVGGAAGLMLAAQGAAVSLLNPSPKVVKGMDIFGAAGNGLNNVRSFHLYWQQLKYHWYIDLYLYRKMHDIAATFAAIEEVARYIEQHPEMTKRMKYASRLISFFDDAHKDRMSEDWNQLREIFSQPTFTGEKSNWVYSRGRVLVAYKLLNDLRDEISDIVVALAEFDTYCSMARLYNEHAEKDAHYCFTQFVDADTPRIDFQEFWHPLVKTPVTNSFVLGGNTVRNCVLTGPNEGGKSTVIKAVSINIILSQTFGMAAARSASITPFSLIATHVHMKDDIGAGNSLFKAEAMRSHDLLTKAKALKPKQFSFMAIDEIFRSTKPEEASAAAYSVLKVLGGCKNNICMVATHFALPTRLEKDTSYFVNYQVPIEKEADGTLKRTYLLQPGIYTECVAFDVLRAQGFESAVMDDAQGMLDKMKHAAVAA